LKYNPGSWLLIIALSLVWGSSFILIKKALLGLTFIQLACLRIGISGVVSMPFILKAVRQINKSDLPAIIAVALTGSGIPAFCYALAETRIDSMTTGILNAMTPVFTLLIGAFFFSQRISFVKSLGLSIGFIGATLLISKTSEQGQRNLFFTLIIILGTICYAISGNTVNRFLRHIKPWTLSFLSFGILIVPVLVILSFHPIEILPEQNPQIWLALAAVTILSIIGTVLANILYYQLIHKTDAVFASLISYFIPIVAIFYGLLDGEKLYLVSIGGLCLILLGVYLVKARDFRN